MRVGVAFPTTEIGNDPAAIRAFAEGAEALGCDYLTCIDHVIQGARAVADDWRAYYTLANPFHEILVLFGYLAAVTRRMELASAILIAPQRQSVLMAKQLAEIDVLSGGRLRAGFGIGWNALEYAALGQSFTTRARRLEEQLALLRALWTQDTVHFEGRWDRVLEAGINPLPVQRPIPCWIGAFAPPAIARAGRLADGLLLNPRLQPDAAARAAVQQFHQAARAHGRDPLSLGLEATVLTEDKRDDALRAEYQGWRELGASHVTVRTMTAGLTSVEQHLRALERALASFP